jgi:AcrR family transcriptional regulator
VLDTALALFRKHGFADTSMRQVAKAAGLSLGAAYYYFPSKDAIVLAYYGRLQEETAVLERKALERATTLRERLEVVYGLKLKAVRRDRKVLSALLGLVASPDSEISLFADETRAVRQSSIQSFADAVAPELAVIPPSARRLLPSSLWALYLVILLYYFHDRSAKQKNTDALVAGTLNMLSGFIPLLSLPFAAPMIDQLGQLAASVGLVPNEESARRSP